MAEDEKKVCIMFGEKILMPYLLDRKIISIDYIFISHFDTDHCQGLLYVLKKMKVKNVVIGQQFIESENLNIFKNIIKEKNVNLIVVKTGNKINIEKNLYFEILWPDSNEKIVDNIINNSALVCKLNYNNFSMLFTGDIEKEAEIKLLKKYTDRTDLKSTILKVAHHGSQTSSTDEFVKAVQPKIALIGVGKNNLYGHPSDEILQRLKNNNIKIYRTDKSGEISIYINKKGKIKIKTNNYG